MFDETWNQNPDNWIGDDEQVSLVMPNGTVVEDVGYGVIRKFGILDIESKEAFSSF